VDFLPVFETRALSGTKQQRTVSASDLSPAFPRRRARARWTKGFARLSFAP
jgi:hypothetical protein